MQITEAFQQLSTAASWQKGTLELTCLRVVQETDDVKTFVFQSTPQTRFHFKPGQFVTLQLEIEGETVYRTYTISSSPSKPYTLELTIKKVEGGQVSGWLLENLKPGDKVKAEGPGGEFNIIDHPAKKVLFLSAGCGITPMMSMSRWLRDTVADVDIHFIHSARTSYDIIFRHELDKTAQRYDNFKLDYVLENIDGFLDAEKLQQLAPDMHDRTIFVCGPAPYMTAVEQMVADSGFDMSRYFQESFGGQLMPELKTEAIAQAEGYQLTLEKSGKVATFDPGQTVLEALENQKAPIIGACRAGVCGSCKVKISEGEVSSTSQMTLTPDEIAEGYVLSCCSTPQSDLSINI
ncbi:FAD-binding oxidoreductase [Endozoicomonadaceae bacterium StTr2]